MPPTSPARQPPDRPRPLIEVLTFPGCPNRDAAIALAARVREQLGGAAQVRVVDVPDQPAAEQVRFLAGLADHPGRRPRHRARRRTPAGVRARLPAVPGRAQPARAAQRGLAASGAAHRTGAPVTDLPPPATPAAGPPSRWRRGRTAGFLAVCLLVFVVLAGGLYFFAPRQAPPGVTMTDLHGIADLQARFNADRGLPRLVVIFSPT